MVRNLKGAEGSKWGLRVGGRGLRGVGENCLGALELALSLPPTPGVFRARTTPSRLSELHRTPSACSLYHRYRVQFTHIPGTNDRQVLRPRKPAPKLRSPFPGSRRVQHQEAGSSWDRQRLFADRPTAFLDLIHIFTPPSPDPRSLRKIRMEVLGATKGGPPISDPSATSCLPRIKLIKLVSRVH